MRSIAMIGADLPTLRSDRHSVVPHIYHPGETRQASQDDIAVLLINSEAEGEHGM